MGNQTVTLQESDDNETIRLVCREDDSLTVKVNSDKIQKSIEMENQRLYNGSLFLFKLQENNNETAERIVYIVR